MVSCNKGPTTPTDPASKASFTVDGQTFQASAKGMSALDRGGNVTDVMTQDCNSGTNVVLSLQGPLAVGSVALTNVIQATLITTSGQWEYKRGQGRGSLTLTSASARVAGTYEFDMPPMAGTSGATKFVQGSFDVSYGNGTVCK